MSWKLINPPADSSKIREMSSRMGISPLLVTLLLQRGQSTAEEISSFLNPALRHLSPLHEWPGLEEGAEILAQSIKNGDKILVWGDYDVDGITSTALIKDFFRRRGLSLDHYIPDRLQEGYGLSMEGIENLAAKGVNTLITVDCGISSSREIERARELGMRTILTDHHLPGNELPPADAIINPKCFECPCQELAGVGAAFLLMAALNRELGDPRVDIRDFLDLVAMGSIADIVDLTGENRILVKNGILLLNQPKRPGIQALKEVSGLDGINSLGSGHVGFALAPRLNAAGRLGSPETAIELLLADDWSTARKKATHLDQMNTRRKQKEEEILQEAREMAGEQKNQMGLVLYSPDWHHGVIGIVASRIVEEFHRPCLILAEQDGVLKGSGRSIPGFDLFSGLKTVQDLLISFGGHKMAAGLTVSQQNLAALREAFSAAVQSVFGDTPPEKKIVADAQVDLKQLTPELLKELDIMQPFGAGNANPVFVSPPLRISSMALFGQGKHVKMELTDPDHGITLRGKIWRRGEEFQNVDLKNKKAIVAYRPKMETYKGLMSINLHISEILEIR